MTEPLPLIIVWRVTTRCNLACPFCAYDRTLSIPRPEADAELIARTAPQIAQWSHETGRTVLVSWLGGEPLLWPPLAELSRHYHGLGIRLSTTTNGTPLARSAIREHLIRHYAELTISVDALESTHDALRGRAGLFAQVRRDVTRLATEINEAGSVLLLRANVVLMRGTIDNFAELCLELASWGIREITCNQLGGADRPEFYPSNRLLPEQVDRLRSEWPSLRDHLASLGVRLLGGGAYLARMAASTRGEPLVVSDCGPGKRFLFIDETGRVSPCGFTGADYGIPLEELSASSWEPPAERFAQAQRCRRSRACDDCLSTQVFQKFAPAPLS